MEIINQKFNNIFSNFNEISTSQVVEFMSNFETRLLGLENFNTNIENKYQHELSWIKERIGSIHKYIGNSKT